MGTPRLDQRQTEARPTQRPVGVASGTHPKSLVQPNSAAGREGVRGCLQQRRELLHLLFVSLRGWQGLWYRPGLGPQTLIFSTSLGKLPP